jgi:uncharacterized protein
MQIQTLKSFAGRTLTRLRLCVPAVLILIPACFAAPVTGPVKTLFLGDQGHHNPSGLYKVIAPVFAAQGVQCDYTEKASDLTADNLTGYSALVIYNNLDTLKDPWVSAIRTAVRGGKGMLVIHCGIVMAGFDARMDTVFGGRFVRHDTAVFRARILMPDHPALKGVETFESWDETYEHKLVGDRTVLMERPAPGGKAEPWTWVRNEGKGRVYYTASGHDTRTWSKAAYQKQLAVALLWTMGKEVVALGPQAPPHGIPGRNPGLVSSGATSKRIGVLRSKDGALEWMGARDGEAFDPAGRRLTW